MGVYIVGMEMPKSGYVDVRIFTDGSATTATAKAPFHKTMPLIELPPHGRLIDADELMSKGFGDEPYKASVKRVLLQATTIIPADKE